MLQVELKQTQYDQKRITNTWYMYCLPTKPVPYFCSKIEMIGVLFLSMAKITPMQGTISHSDIGEWVIDYITLHVCFGLVHAWYVHGTMVGRHAETGDKNPIWEPCLPYRWPCLRGTSLTLLVHSLRVITDKRPFPFVFIEMGVGVNKLVKGKNWNLSSLALF